MLVTLAEAKTHLRMEVDYDNEDADLTLKIRAASNAIRRYLGTDGLIYEQAEDSDGEPETDSSGDEVWETDSSGEYVVRYDVQAACLLLIGELYRNREGVFQDTQPGYLPPSVVSLLYPLRDPVTA